jgi:hypothetical protein
MSIDVSKVTTLDDHPGIAKFFEGCLIEQKDVANGAKL